MQALKELEAELEREYQQQWETLNHRQGQEREEKQALLREQKEEQEREAERQAVAREEFEEQLARMREELFQTVGSSNDQKIINEAQGPLVGILRTDFFQQERDSYNNSAKCSKGKDLRRRRTSYTKINNLPYGLKDIVRDHASLKEKSLSFY